MLTDSQLRTCVNIYNNADSVFDAISYIENYLGRNLTPEEKVQITGGATTKVTAEIGEVVAADTVETAEPGNVVAMRKLATQIVDTYARKNKDYGDSFGKSVRHYGFIAALTRLSDKFNRVENFILAGIKNGMVSDESLRDTLIDMATYALMTVIALDEEASTNNGNFGC